MFRQLLPLVPVLSLALPASAAAQAAPVEPVPAVSDLEPVGAAPKDYVLDDAGFFPRDISQSLRNELAEFRKNTGVSLYVSILTYLVNESSDARARRSLAAWLKPGEAGLVMAHDKGSGNLSFAGSGADPRLPKPQDLVRAFGHADAAVKALPPETPPYERMATSVRRLMEVLNEWKSTGGVPQLDRVTRVVETVTPAPSSPAAAAQAGTKASSSLTIPLDRRPDKFLLDDARVFSPEAAAALEGKLAGLNQKYDVDLFVVTMTYPPEVAGGFPADALREVWLGDRPGGVMVYDRSRPKDLAISGAASGGAWITPLRLESIHRDARAAATAAAGTSQSDGITAAVDLLVEKYVAEGVPVRDEAKRLTPTLPPGVFPMVAFTFCAGAAGLYLFYRWQEAADRRRGAVRLLPDVQVSRRLGAPHGGGVVAEIRAGEK